MKKILIWLLTLTICFPAVARVFTYTHNGQALNYEVTDEDAKTCAVASVSIVSGNLDIPSSVSDGNNNYSVTRINPNSFASCQTITSVTIPNSVTSIGSVAFVNCQSLTSVFIPNSVTSLESMVFYLSGLKHVYLPNSITSIGSSAFGYSKIASITIPASVTSIGDEAFIECTSLKEIRCLSTVPPSLLSKWVFDGCSSSCKIYIPEGSLSDYCNSNWKRSFNNFVECKLGGEKETFVIQNFFIEPGQEAYMPVQIQTEREYSQFTTDVNLPTGLEAVTTQDGAIDAKIDCPISEHNISSSVQADGCIRLTVKGSNNGPFDSNETSFLIRVRATEQLPATPVSVWFRNTMFNDAAGNAYLFNDANPHINSDKVMGRTDIEVDPNTPAVYYNMQGQPVQNLKHGNIYIRVQSNKATKLVY